MRPFRFMPLPMTASMALSCQPSGEKIGKPYKALVLVAHAPSSPESRATFTLEPKSFTTLSSFEELSGTYFKIWRGGELVIKESNGSLVEADRFTGGQSPSLRYSIKNDVAIARDYSSLAMMSAAWQFEVIFTGMEEAIGLTPATFSSTLGRSRMGILFEPKLEFSDENTTGSMTYKLNAAFIPTAKQFVLFQRAPLEHVPLSMNLQVLSHEFGHAVFDHAFYAGAMKDNDRTGQEHAISGINEGFADLTSFAFTGSANVLRASLDFEEMAEDRNFATSTFVFSELYPAITEDEAECSGSFYCIGTIFARAMYKTLNNLPGMTKKEFMASLTEALRTTREAMLAQPDTILPADQSEKRKEMSPAEQETYDGQVLGAFFNSLISKLPATWTAEVCTQLKSEFGETGFPTAARGVCP